MNKAKILTLALLLILTGCSSSELVKTGKKIQVEEAENVEKGRLVLGKISKPDVPDRIEPNKISDSSIQLTSYISSMSLSKQKVYEELLNTVKTYGSTFIPSSSLSESDANLMMRILIMDEPLAFVLNNNYSYELDNKGYVKYISLSYRDLFRSNKLREDIDKLVKGYKQADDEKLTRDTFKGLFSNIRGNNFYSEKSFLTVDQLIDKLIAYKKLDGNYSVDEQKIKEEYRKIIPNTFLSSAFTKYHTEASIADLFNLIVRQNGGEVINIYGQRTTVNKYTKTENYKNFTPIVTKQGNKTNVIINKENLNAWNVYRSGANWYVADFIIANEVVQKIVHVKGLEEISTDNIIFGSGMSDIQSSVTKLAFANESILGVYPMSYDDLASSARTSADVFLDTTRINEIKDDLAKNITDINKKRLFISFSDKKVYDHFLLSHDIIIKDLQEKSLTNIKGYDTIELPEVQTIILYNLKY